MLRSAHVTFEILIPYPQFQQLKASLLVRKCRWLCDQQLVFRVGASVGGINDVQRCIIAYRANAVVPPVDVRSPSGESIGRVLVHLVFQLVQQQIQGAFFPVDGRVRPEQRRQMELEYLGGRELLHFQRSPVPVEEQWNEPNLTASLTISPPSPRRPSGASPPAPPDSAPLAAPPAPLHNADTCETFTR